MTATDITAHDLPILAPRASSSRPASPRRIGDHEGAAAALGPSTTWRGRAELRRSRRRARLSAAPTPASCAPTALCDDDLHVRSVPLWQNVIDAHRGTGRRQRVDRQPAGARRHRVRQVLHRDRGRLAEAEPWLRRAGARAEAREWELATARTRLERATASWAAGRPGDHRGAGPRGLPGDRRVCPRQRRVAMLAVLRADQDVGRRAPGRRRVLGARRTALARARKAAAHPPYSACSAAGSRSSAVATQDAVDMVAQARDCLDASPRSSWLAYARLDDHLGIGVAGRRARRPRLRRRGSARTRTGLTPRPATAPRTGVTRAEPGSRPVPHARWTSWQRAAELKVPAALAVDSVRYSITDAEARAQWADLRLRATAGRGVRRGVGVGEQSN